MKLGRGGKGLVFLLQGYGDTVSDIDGEIYRVPARRERGRQKV